MKKVFSFDAETDGLWGSPIAIAATVTSPEGVEVAQWSGRVIFFEGGRNLNPWVQENVLPHIIDLKEYRTAYEMLQEFSKFYLANKNDSVIIAHCPVPVEANVLRFMHDNGFIGDWDGPFPLMGIEGLLDAAGENPTEATAYMLKHGLPLPEGSAHNPLYDCRVATAMYRHLKGW